MIIWAKKFDAFCRIVSISGKTFLYNYDGIHSVLLYQEVPVYLHLNGIYKGAVKPNPGLWGPGEIKFVRTDLGIRLEVWL